MGCRDAGEVRDDDTARYLGVLINGCSWGGGWKLPVERGVRHRLPLLDGYGRIHCVPSELIRPEGRGVTDGMWMSGTPVV